MSTHEFSKTHCLLAKKALAYLSWLCTLASGVPELSGLNHLQRTRVVGGPIGNAREGVRSVAATLHDVRVVE